MNVVSKTVSELTSDESTEILIHLTHAGSEFQQEVRNRHGSQTPIALVFRSDGVLATWVATHTWRDLQTLEGYTREDSRRRGLAKLACAVLVADGSVDPELPTAVFSPDFVGVSQSIGCRRVLVYQWRDNDWREVS
jgi:hypothetical protein